MRRHENIIAPVNTYQAEIDRSFWSLADSAAEESVCVWFLVGTKFCLSDANSQLYV
jgi:hypothetical protein